MHLIKQILKYRIPKNIEYPQTAFTAVLRPLVYIGAFLC